VAETKILIVEDEGIVAMDIQHNLKKLGYAVPAIAASGESAIEKAVEIRPDLVLMDIVLKGQMDGIEAAEEICARFDVPVVFLTAQAEEKTLQRIRVTRHFGYILKPFADRELQHTIETALYRHQVESEFKEKEKHTSSIEIKVPRLAR
jgi:CheY-like chemotaxis protein